MKNKISRQKIKIVKTVCCAVCCTLLSAGSVIAASSLGLQSAVDSALANDPWLVGNKHAQDSMEAMSVASGTLPDPKVSLGAANLPTDTFNLDQEPMTQLKIGVTQMIPRGDTLDLTRQQLQMFSTQFPLQRKDREARVAVMVSDFWLEAYKAQESIFLIEKDRPLFEQLADVAEASYSAALGRTRQQDIVRAQLELTRLDDRLTKLKQQKEMALENLGGWINENFRREYKPSEQLDPQAGTGNDIALDSMFPDIKMLDKDLFTAPGEIDPQQLYQYLLHHPAVSDLDQKIKANDLAVELAKQKYKPEWGLSASYGYRADTPDGSDRADFLSVGVSFDLPIFTKNRQDKQMASARSKALSTATQKWQLLRRMVADFEKYRLQLRRLNQREDLYQQTLLPQMHEQAEASLTAYTNDDGDFAEVVRARIAELNARIDYLAISIEKQKTITQLNYYVMQVPNDIVAINEITGDRK
ncbi:TolC family protein [Desulforhopalus singaporensis]|uniref:Outer membrane protein TolC n=1 Tax=Desulforhopalus singaporensis TaxID=91360 RepID=A0A1H0N974_9BACT|nr:TolC family protein [Desulforhopalus singaporensis]SDO89252.1 Outer membrane protein TolC [Desulforhopalus singaporensis]